MNVDAQDPALAGAPAKPSRRISLRSVTSGFHALRVRNFRLFIAGQVVSLTGTWMETTAQAWLVLQLSNSPFALGFVTTLQFLPVMILSLYGGVLADRLPKRRTLIITQSLLLVEATIFGLLVVTNSIQIWHLYVLALYQGIIQAVDTPVRQAFVAEMVGRDELVNAVALNSMTFNTARILGPAIAGIVIATLGVAPALFLNAISFVAVVYALYLMRESELFASIPVARGSTWKHLKEGLNYTWRTPRILIIMIALAAIGTFGYNFTVILPLIADFVLHADAAGFGALSSFLGAGSLLAAISTAYVKELTLKRMFLGAAVFSFLLALTAITPVYAISAVILVGLGASAIIFSTTTNSLLQLNTPDNLRGRVMSLNVLLVMGSTPVGAFLIGLLSEHLGVPIVLIICAICCGVGVAAAYFYGQRHQPQLNYRIMASDKPREFSPEDIKVSA